jgi:hypothetical protein
MMGAPEIFTVTVSPGIPVTGMVAFSATPGWTAGNLDQSTNPSACIPLEQALTFTSCALACEKQAKAQTNSDTAAEHFMFPPIPELFR